MLYTPFHQLTPSMNLVISHSVMEAMFHLTMITTMISPTKNGVFFPVPVWVNIKRYPDLAESYEVGQEISLAPEADGCRVRVAGCLGFLYQECMAEVHWPEKKGQIHRNKVNKKYINIFLHQQWTEKNYTLW